MKQLAYFFGLLVASVCLANVIRVPEDYVLISVAVTEAAEGDTILLSPGTFHVDETIELTKSITMIGSLSEDNVISTTISGTSRLIIDNWNNFPNNYSVTLENLALESTGTSYFAVDIDGCQSLTIRKCSFSNTRSPINANASKLEVVDSCFRNITGYVSFGGVQGTSTIVIKTTIFDNYNGIAGRSQGPSATDESPRSGDDARASLTTSV